MTSTVTTHNAPALPTQGRKKHYRPDIQGLRAVAVLLVLIYHGGVTWIPGGYVGVDVFFVISGFLITGLLIRELTKTGTISLSDFYARRARRILPAAVVMILATLAMAFLWLPKSRWESIGLDALGASFSVVNWQFAIGSTDYLQQEEAPSPLQHYWSLAVEEQYYLVWPLLLLIVIVGLPAFSAARRRALGTGAARPFVSERVIRTRVLAVSLVVVALSLVHSIVYTPVNPGAAYFITTTRMWELAVGAALAAAMPLMPALPTALRAVLGWVGMVGVLTAALVFDAETYFPGFAALLPVLGSALVILAGTPGQDAVWSVSRLLGLRPMRFMGDISFSLYLVHWPVLVVVGSAAFEDEMPAKYGVLVALATILPAWLSYRFVEQPFMRWKFVQPRWNALRMGGVSMVVTGLAAASLVLVPMLSHSQDVPTETVAGAKALVENPQAGIPMDSVEQFVPNTTDAEDDRSAVYDDGCHVPFEATEPKTDCVYGDEDADTKIALIGDSHAAHWLPALQEAGEESGWQVHAFTKSACAVIATSTIRTVNDTPTEYTECLEWNKSLLEEVETLNPDLVVISGSTHTSAGDATIADGMASAWQKYTDAGIDVVVINDVPRQGIHVPECVDRNSDSLTECAPDRDDAIAASGAPDLKTASELHGDVKFLDVTDFICPADRCAPIIGGVLVYADSHHMTATYSATLSGKVAEELKLLL